MNNNLNLKTSEELKRFKSNTSLKFEKNVKLLTKLIVSNENAVILSSLQILVNVMKSRSFDSLYDVTLSLSFIFSFSHSSASSLTFSSSSLISFHMTNSFSFTITASRSALNKNVNIVNESVIEFINLNKKASDDDLMKINTVKKMLNESNEKNTANYITLKN